MLYVAVLPLIAVMLVSGPALAQARPLAEPGFVDVEKEAGAERLRACPNGRWRWRETEIPTPTARAAQELDVAGGRLIGTYRGGRRVAFPVARGAGECSLP